MESEDTQFTTLTTPPPSEKRRRMDNEFDFGQASTEMLFNSYIDTVSLGSDIGNHILSSATDCISEGTEVKGYTVDTDSTELQFIQPNSVNSQYNAFTAQQIDNLEIKQLYCEESQTRQILMSDESFKSIMVRLEVAEKFRSDMLSFPHNFTGQPSISKNIVNTVASERGQGVVQYIHPPKSGYSIMRYKRQDTYPEVVQSYPPNFACPEVHDKWNYRIHKYPIKSFREMNFEASNPDTDAFSDEDDITIQNNTFYNEGGSMKGYRSVSSAEYKSKLYTMMYSGTKSTELDINYYKYKRSMIYENRNKLRQYQFKTLYELLPEYLSNPFTK